jgi:putative hydrolase of the HAD superfamily
LIGVVSRALLLDVGHVIIEASWRAVRAYEAATGTPMPFPDDLEPQHDPRWRAGVDSDAVGDRYWDEVARRAGLDGLIGLFRALGNVVPEAMFDPAAVALMDDTRLAGLPVGILTNHAHMVMGRSWFAARPEFAGLDTFIDAAEIGVPKPHPQAYLTAAGALGVPPEDVVFLDDTPECAEGARAVGMTGILVDPRDRRPAFDQARRLLGL